MPFNKEPPQQSVHCPGYSQRADFTRRAAFLREHIFLQTHVPKTGGTALYHALAGLFGGVHVLDTRLSRMAAYETLPPEMQNEIHFISGHFSYGVHDSINRQALYIAAVREPVSRAVSVHRYMQTATSQPEHEICRDMPFEDAWVELHKRFKAHGPNWQSQMLWGGSDISEDGWAKLQARIDEDYLLVLPQDRISHMMPRLRAAFGLHASPVARVNVSKTEQFEPSEEVAAQIRTANALDARVYDFVAETFEARLERACNFIAEHCLEPWTPDDAPDSA